MTIEKLVRFTPQSVQNIILNFKESITRDFLADVHLFSYPRSGITWAKFFMMHYQALVYDIKPELGFGQSFRKPHRSAPRIAITPTGPIGHNETHMGKFHTIEADEMARYMETVLSKYKGKNIILFVRDPRDVVVSHYIHMGMEKKGISISDYIRDGKYGIQSIIDYLNAFTRKKHTFKSFYISRYVDKRNEPIKFFGELVQKLHYPFDQQKLEEAVERSKFDNMKKIQDGEVSHDAERFITPEAATQGPRVRKGKVGSYADMLNKEDLVYVNLKMKSLDEEYGYVV